MSQHLLDRCTDAETLVAARLLEGAHAVREAIDLVRDATEAPGNELRARRARWLLALAEVQGGVEVGGDLRLALEGVLDEPPSDGTVLDELRSRARRLLGAEEALREALAAAEDGDVDRSEAALSLAFSDAQDFGPREEARRCACAAEALMRRREDTRARSLLRVAQARYAEAGAAKQELSVALRLGDNCWRSGDLSAAWSVFDEARASARLHERPSEELALLRRLLALAALRRDPRAVRRLAQELEERLRGLPEEEARERAISHWVAACVLRRCGERNQALAALSRTLHEAERARDMPLAWLAAAQLGEPLPNELIRRLQRPPVEASDLLTAATDAASRDADPDLKRGLLEGALRMIGRSGVGVQLGSRFEAAPADVRSRCEAALEALPRLDLD